MLRLPAALLVTIVGLLAHATVQAVPQRIVSLSPHLTEAVFWLNAEQRLLGRDRFSDYPAGTKTIPVVGDAYSLNIEALVALKPDLVLVWQAPQALKAQLNKLDLPTFDTNPQSVSQVYSELKRLAELLSIKNEEQFLVLRQTIKSLADHKSETTKRALLLVQHQPPIALGLGDPLAASLSHCGWENSLQQANSVVNLSPEYLWAGDYNVIINLSSPHKSNYKKPTIQPLADPLVRPGPRFPAALKQLCIQLDSL